MLYELVYKINTIEKYGFVLSEGCEEFAIS